MEVQFGPNPVDESNLLYKLQRKVKVFNTSNSLPHRGYNLITTSSKYGIVFVASPQGVLSAYTIKELIDPVSEPRHLSTNLQVQPTHIAVNCDQEWLAVVGGQMLLIYKITDFQNPAVGHSIQIRCEVSPSTFLSSIQWNPCIPDTIALVYFDGTLVVSQVNTMQKKQIQSNARCMCWSPKGKQLVTGNADGTLCQYKPDLSPMKSVPAPNLFEGAPVEALAIYWISTFQFAVVYRNASDNSRPVVTIVNTPKGGKPSCMNFEDICYSMGSNRPWFYYLQGLSQWNLIIASSSNSMEIATMGSKDSANWIQWCQSDEARPELPLTDKKIENYPVGLCVDTAAAHQLPWGENEVLPPMPFLLALSHTGMLTIFNIINLDKAAPQICTPIQPLSLPEAAFTSEVPNDVPAQPQQLSQEPPKLQPITQQPQPVAQPLQAANQQPQQVAQPFAQQAAQPFGQQVAQPFAQQVAQPFAQQVAQPVAQPQPTQQAISHFGQQFAQSQVLQKVEPPTGLFLAQALQSSNAQKQSAAAVAASVKVEANAPSAAEIEKSKAEAAAIKREQEQVNKAKVELELKNILIKEVNDFQSELHRFRVNTCGSQIKIQQQLEAVKPDLDLRNLDGEQLKKQCGLEELRDSIVHLKLELVRACAVVAEARTHAEAKEHHEWSQVDPLTAKRFSSIKQLAYYVQNQLDQAQRELESRWNDMASKTQRGKGDRMIRPILDDVYQPLVEQQEILCRQKAVLRTLRSTMNECNTTPLFKSTSLLRSTPFKNKDPLSKLTKNILNMSIEPQDNKDKELSAQKLDALRDMLSNHRPKKIKPVSVEVRQYMENLRQRYEKGVKERAEKRDMEKHEQMKLEKQKIETEMQEKARIQYQLMEAKKEQRIEAERQKDIKPQFKTELPAPAPAPQFNSFIKSDPSPKETSAPVAAFASSIKPAQPTFASFSKTLFSDVPKQEVSLPQVQPVKTENSQRSLKDYLQSDVEIPKICSPTAFATPKTTSNSVFSSKPIAEMSNMFNKLTTPDTKPVKPTPTSDETGEVESSSTPIKTPIQPVKEKPLGSIFSLKPTAPLTNVQNVPDVLKNQTMLGKTESKPKTEETQKPKENVPQVEVKITAKKEELKPFTIQSTTVPPLSTAQSVFIIDPKKPSEVKIESSLPASFYTSTPSTPASPVASTPQVSATVTVKAVTSPKDPPTNDTKSEKEVEKPVQSVPSKTESSTPTTATPVTIESTSPTAKSVFSSASKSLFSPTSESKPLFASTSPTTQAATTSTPQDTSFGQAAITTSTISTTIATSSAFGTAQSVFSAANSAFGTTTTASSVFGTTPAFGTSSVIGATPSSPSAVFGSAAQAAFGQTTGAGFGVSTTQSLFGSAPTTSAFGATTTTPSIFGSSKPVFGSTPAFGASSPTSVFGSPTTQSSVFGATPTTQASVFGSAPTTQASPFGSPTNTGSGSLFGDGGSNLFAAANISTTSASQSGGSLFGGSSGFGSANANVFGAKSTFSGSNATAASIFGGGSSFSQKPANDFWGGETNATPFGSSGFGQAESGSFSQPSTAGQPFGSPQQTAFGSPQQQAAPGFGSSSVFGGKPAFGSPTSFGGSGFGGANKSPGFGSSATFGGGATFGGTAFGNTSPGKAFGGASPTGFGTPTQSNATFENLATQNTLTFGNLAQNSGQAPAAAPAFNASPSFTGWRG
ncbi:nuclear pore complex protein Nup214-like isoform X1 [Pieris napi]|uniref:nuclear pore complex protein Nup214-like isoform X1 n=1 Tax=Pieris napi TaxID=78633 RepID=UPI001FB98D39|nr:nuclear pore complex protein Nup214-like isoform X1 [Pieris napi]